MPIRRRTLTILAAAVATLVALAVGAAWLLARSEYAAGRAAAVLTDATGLPARVERVRLWPGLGMTLALEGVTLSGADASQPLFAAGRLEATVPWRALWSDDLALQRVVVERARVRYDIDKAGRDAWTPVFDHVIAWIGPGPSAFDIGELQFVNCALSYRDQRSGSAIEFSAIGLEASDVRPKSVFPAKMRTAWQSGADLGHASLVGEFTVDPDQSRYAADRTQLKAWFGGDALPLAGVDARAGITALRIDLEAGTASAEVPDAEVAGMAFATSVQLRGLDASPVANFRLQTQDFNPRAAAAALAVTLPEMADDAALTRARIAVQGEASAEMFSAEASALAIDDTLATGSLRWPLSGAATPFVRLDADRVVLGRYLPPAVPNAKPVHPGAAIEQALAQLRKLDLDARIRIGEARVAGAVATELVLTVEPQP
ncbi:MAG: hypothetical protein IT483_03245 [Gammaproteobacteria bacterium]|nr:hypothetical protein [Gammaproteobacteria bacterium]